MYGICRVSPKGFGLNSSYKAMSKPAFIFTKPYTKNGFKTSMFAALEYIADYPLSTREDIITGAFLNGA
jgi:hypothetical protein